MHLTDEEKSMRAGGAGRARHWAIQHHSCVGSHVRAVDLVPVSPTRIIKSAGVAGVDWLERLVKVDPEPHRPRLRILPT